MAPGAHHVVLRDLPAARPAARLSCSSRIAGRSCSTATTKARASGIARPRARGDAVAPVARRSRAPGAPTSTRRMAARCSADPRDAGPGRARHRPRAAAPGAAADRHQARAVPESARAALPARSPRGGARSAAAARHGPRRGDGLWHEQPGGIALIGPSGDGLRFDNERPAPPRVAGAVRVGGPAGDQRRVAGSSWPTAATAPRRCGSPTGGPGCSRSAGRAALLERDGEHFTP